MNELGRRGSRKTKVASQVSSASLQLDEFEIPGLNISEASQARDFIRSFSGNKKAISRPSSR
jgi:hypothetical protein